MTYLNFDKYEREGVGEGYVAKCLKTPPYLLCLAYTPDADSGQTSSKITGFCSYIYRIKDEKMGES